MTEVTAPAALIVVERAAERDALREVLARGTEYAVDAARRFRDGLNLLANTRYELVLLDPRVRGTDREEAIRAVIACAHPAPVVVVADEDDEHLEARALQLGAQDFLVAGHARPTAVARIFRRAIERQRLVLDLEAARTRAEHLATHDPLTRLPTRALFRDRALQAIAWARRYRKSVGVLFVDLDRFKEINDGFGHDAGDRLLRGVADRLRGAVRGSDTVARHGGDEFLVLAADLDDVAGAATLARTLTEELRAPYDIAAAPVRCRARIGVAVYPAHGDAVDDLVRRADRAMYLAKHAGGATFRIAERVDGEVP